MDHLLNQALIIEREGQEPREVHGRLDRRKAFFATGTDVHPADVVISGGRRFKVTEVIPVQGHIEVSHLEARLRLLPA